MKYEMWQMWKTWKMWKRKSEYFGVIIKWKHINLGVSENVVYPIVPNGFADHYPVMKNG